MCVRHFGSKTVTESILLYMLKGKLRRTLWRHAKANSVAKWMRVTDDTGYIKNREVMIETAIRVSFYFFFRVCFFFFVGLLLEKYETLHREELARDKGAWNDARAFFGTQRIKWCAVNVRRTKCESNKLAFAHHSIFSVGNSICARTLRNFTYSSFVLGTRRT